MNPIYIAMIVASAGTFAVCLSFLGPLREHWYRRGYRQAKWDHERGGFDPYICYVSGAGEPHHPPPSPP